MDRTATSSPTSKRQYLDAARSGSVVKDIIDFPLDTAGPIIHFHRIAHPVGFPRDLESSIPCSVLNPKGTNMGSFSSPRVGKSTAPT